METRFSFNFVNVEILHDSPLGSGAYGAVYKAKCDKLPCAAKILHSSFMHMSDTLERFRQECDFLESIKHPNIVQFLGLYSDPKSNQTALIMELMDESLTTFLDRYNAFGSVPYYLQVNICYDVVLALHYLHTNKIIHRDLSSNNVLLLGGCIAKVTDLGVSRIKDAIQQQKMTQCPGSPVYMPPEALRLQPIYSEKLDTFSFGVLVIQIQTRRFPNPEPHEVLIADAASPTGFVSMPVKESDRRDKDISLMADNQLKTIALLCIEDIAKQRPYSAELCDRLEEIKLTQEYIDSKNSKPVSQGSLVNTEMEGSKDELIENLKSEIRHYQHLMEKRGGNRASADILSNASASLPAFVNHGGYDGNENLEPPSLEETLEAHPMAFADDEGKRIISNLSPDMVTLLSQNDMGSISGIVYNQPRPDCITIMADSRMQLNSKVQQVMVAYQKMASTPSQLSFVHVPDNCPLDEVNSMVKEYNMAFKPSAFSYIKDINSIQVISTNPSSHSKAIDQVQNAFKYTMYLSGGRKLTLKRGDITKENVSVLVTATNRYLTPSGGMSKAVNTASRGKMEQYCKEHVDRNGPLRECDIVTTRSGGDLKCKWVVHALGPDGAKSSPGECQKKTMMLVRKCLVEGNELKGVSIAIPAISTGHHHVKTKIAANGIIAAVLDFDFQEHHSLRDIRIVIIDDRTFTEFGEVFEDRMVDLYGQSHFLGSSEQSFDHSSIAAATSSVASSCRTQ